MSERVLYAKHDVTVTTHRFIAPGGTIYVLDNITSVAADVRRGSALFPGCLIMLGVMWVVASPWVGGIFGLLGIVWLYLRPTHWDVIITTAAGQQTGFTSRDEQVSVDVFTALSDAIGSR